MRLSRIVKTSSFRLTLLYAAISCLSSILLFGVIYWSAAGFMEGQIDNTVSSEIAEIEADAAGGTANEMTATVDALTRRSPDFFYLLQDGGGKVLAGNLPPMAPVLGTHEQRTATLREQDRTTTLRGNGVELPGGAYLFVALSTHELHEMQGMIKRAFLWGLGATILLSLASGAVMSVSILRRVEALSRVSREIVAGDLQRRIPLRGSDDEFDHLATSVNAMLDRIQGLMDGLRQVSSDIAHDLRTPLTRLRQRVELALRKAGDVASLRAAFEGTLRDVDAILETFSALLRIAQIESSARRAQFTAVDLTEILRTAVEVYMPIAEEKRQTVVEAIQPDLLVRGDRELLLQLFANLIENAVHHTAEMSNIMIRAERSQAHVEVVVADNGAGIPEELRSRVFRRFFRLEASRTTPGSGLGLSLAAAIASLHAATIVLSDNRPGLHASISLLAG